MNAHARPTKPFAWSYSSLKNFETCERRHYQVDKLKAFKEEESEQLKWGGDLHSALAAAIGKGTPLPVTMQRYAPFVELAKKYGTASLHTEMKLSFDRGFQPTGYFDNGTWFRGVIDVLMRTKDPTFAVMFDWKTGKILEDLIQLGLFATMLFAHYPELERIATSYVWLGNDATTNEVWTKADMARLWTDLLPRVKRMEAAYYATEYAAIPGGLCKRYCPVATCEYHGRGSY